MKQISSARPLPISPSPSSPTIVQAPATPGLIFPWEMPSTPQVTAGECIQETEARMQEALMDNSSRCMDRDAAVTLAGWHLQLGLV